MDWDELFAKKLVTVYTTIYDNGDFVSSAGGGTVARNKVNERTDN